MPDTIESSPATRTITIKHRWTGATLWTGPAETMLAAFGAKA